MSTVSHTEPASPESLVERTDCHTAHFATRWLEPSMAVVTAHGELDAANAQEFVDYALRHAAHMNCLVLDLSGIEFFGTAGFSALHTLNVRCAGESIEWAMAPSPAVSRLLRICDPDSALPIRPGVEAALAAVQGEPRRLLQLVSKPR
ncbi:MAG TPA: STAS domain-containing protein [Mycobacterium sp.]|nr:STAS domain-containing protein [Mycobacterium sp.]